MEFYPFYSFRGHRAVFLTTIFQPAEWSRLCLFEVVPKTTRETEELRLEKNVNLRLFKHMDKIPSRIPIAVNLLPPSRYPRC